ncbi:hypothetical protein [Flavobacterium sp.]|uniref:hypothetical protein n=1 Tax=Flavobacterium sp. TaxID=239 RepID=UPI0038FC20C5
MDDYELPEPSTLYSTVFSNVVTFKSQETRTGDNTNEVIGTLIDKKNTIKYGSPEGEVFELVKE